ncbi:nuclear pore complex protein Nup107-like [Gigantopelta aegis]|uniref:nuclear pore complex protein Nup107-like n=1 Tax=Gigantopelta aegis TaxID=1735272 RepID=UPI001B88A1CC|nr:nuclear pore complex protein Nup107-like [Gigantopelta aegis]
MAFNRTGSSQNPLESILEGNMPPLREKDKGNVFKRRSVNLNRSIQLLDEAVGSPSYLPLTPKTPRGRLLRHSHYTPVKVPSSSNFDVSQMFTPTPRKGQFDVTEDITTTNVSLLMEEDPGLAASSGLYHDFQQSMKRNPAPQQVFDLLSDYEQVCKDQVYVLKKLVSRAVPQQDKCKKTYKTLGLLDKEKVTWQLVHSLYRDRTDTEINNHYHEEDMLIEGAEKIATDQNLVDNLYAQNDTLRRSQLVIDWLESCASENLDMLADNVKFFSDQPVAWENTLHHLKNKVSGVPMASDRPLVDELDPDAPIRQNRILDDLDKEDEDRLLQHIFICLRAGQLEKAQEVCQKCGQFWRAATLEGWRLYHDPNYEKLGPDNQMAAVRGNPYRDVWKKVCWNMANETKLSMCEKAIYAVFSGNLPALLPMCRSWTDHVWAYFKVMVDVQVEKEIRTKGVPDRKLDDLPPSYWDRLMEPRNVFEQIEASPDEIVRNESEHWFCVIEKYIILGDVGALIEVMHNWVVKTGQELPGHLLRFMCHLILFLRAVGHATKEELCTTILEAYVEHIITNKHSHLVAHYVARLPRQSQVIWYAKFLEGIEDRTERQSCLQQAEEEGLDIPLITKTVVENIRHRDTFVVKADTTLPPETTVSEEDRKKIEAIDWLVFDPTQRAEAMKQANAVMRSFIALKKHLAAREVFEKLPADSVDLIMRYSHQQKGSVGSSDENAIREYLCIRAYLDAVESFNSWFSLFHHDKPVKPDLIVGGNFTERVAYEHRLKQYEAENDRWKHNVTQQTRVTRDRIFNVLLFTDGGWMKDQRGDDEDSDPLRTSQMESLRKLYLPALCFNLHYLLHSTRMYAECLQLADVIASEQYQLYKTFDKDELQRLLRLFRESSLALLDIGKDPLGYELV